MNTYKCPNCDCLIHVADGQRWIPVSERLPEKDGGYLVYLEGYLKGPGYMEVVKFTPNYRGAEEHLRGKTIWYKYDSDYGDCELSSVTHWMQLPVPPEEV